MLLIAKGTVSKQHNRKAAGAGPPPEYPWVPRAVEGAGPYKVRHGTADDHRSPLRGAECLKLHRRGGPPPEYPWVPRAVEGAGPYKVRHGRKKRTYKMV